MSCFKGLWDIKAPHYHIIQITGSKLVVRLSALSTRHPLLPGRFLVLIPIRGWVKSHTEAGRIRSIEKSNNLIRNQIRDLLACSIVPQTTILPCVSGLTKTSNYYGKLVFPVFIGEWHMREHTQTYVHRKSIPDLVLAQMSRVLT
jgi:hypothetical protein